MRHWGHPDHTSHPFLVGVIVGANFRCFLYSPAKFSHVSFKNKHLNFSHFPYLIPTMGRSDRKLGSSWPHQPSLPCGRNRRREL